MGAMEMDNLRDWEAKFRRVHCRLADGHRVHAALGSAGAVYPSRPVGIPALYGIAPCPDWIEAFGDI